MLVSSVTLHFLVSSAAGDGHYFQARSPMRGSSVTAVNSAIVAAEADAEKVEYIVAG